MSMLKVPANRRENKEKITGKTQFYFRVNLFLDEVPSSKLNLHGGVFRKYGYLGLFEAKHTCVGTPPSFVSGLNAWIVVFGVEQRWVILTWMNWIEEEDTVRSRERLTCS